MENTQLVDSGLVVLAIVGGLWLAQRFYRNRNVAVGKFTLIVVNTAALWCLFNWVAHTVAVVILNVQRMLAGSWTYTFHFYALMLMGITFIGLSVFQVNRIQLMSRGKYYLFNQLTLVCWIIILLSLPIAPINPIGLLPVLSSSLILVTMAVTRDQWNSTTFKGHSRKIVSA
jgi:hypothetical protein